MLRIGSRFRWAVIGLCLWGVAGCGGGGPTHTGTPEEQADRVTLDDLAETYRMYSIAQKKPPQKVDDLVGGAMSGNGVAAAQAGNVVVQWGATLPDTGEEPGKVPSPEILAYMKQVPEQGGYVLLLDRTVKKMTADEFKAATKAGGK